MILHESEWHCIGQPPDWLTSAVVPVGTGLTILILHGMATTRVFKPAGDPPWPRAQSLAYLVLMVQVCFMYDSCCRTLANIRQSDHAGMSALLT
jgi:hypothetical protein